MPDSALPDDSVITSEFFDTYIRQQVNTSCVSVGRPAGVEARMITETDTNLVLVYDGSGWVAIANYGAWTSYTPTVSQGVSTDIAKTVDYAKYIRHGRMITVAFKLSMTAAGTAGSNLVVTLPVSATDNDGVVGSGRLFDTSTSTSYGGSWTGFAVGTAIFQGDWSGTGAWGGSPNLAIASGDVLQGSITYEAAS